MRRALTVAATTLVGVAALVTMGSSGLAGSDDAPLPRCERSPGSLDQGEEVTVRGSGWADGSTVSLSFDGFVVDDDDLTDDTTDDTTVTTGGADDEDDGADGDGATTETVNDNGRFRVEMTVPLGAARGTHSINVAGLDADGEHAVCARTVRLSDHPVLDTTDDTGPGGTTPGTTGTTGGTTPGSAPGSTPTTESTTPDSAP